MTQQSQGMSEEKAGTPKRGPSPRESPRFRIESRPSSRPPKSLHNAVATNGQSTSGPLSKETRNRRDELATRLSNPALPLKFEFEGQQVDSSQLKPILEDPDATSKANAGVLQSPSAPLRSAGVPELRSSDTPQMALAGDTLADVPLPEPPASPDKNNSVDKQGSSSSTEMEQGQSAETAQESVLDTLNNELSAAVDNMLEPLSHAGAFASVLLDGVDVENSPEPSENENKSKPERTPGGLTSVWGLEPEQSSQARLLRNFSGGMRIRLPCRHVCSKLPCCRRASHDSKEGAHKKVKRFKAKDLINPQLLKLQNDGQHAEGINARKWRCELKEKEFNILVREIRDAAAAAKWAKFDLFFGLFVVLNGLMIGVQADHRDVLPESTWALIENLFLYVFILELVLRTCLAGLRHMLKDVWTYFDVIIIGVSLLDTYYLSTQADLGSVTILRIVRLFRLARLIRLFRLLKELWLLVMGLYISAYTVFWSLVLFIICLYVFAILLVGIVKEDVTIVGDVRKRWDTIPRAMWTLIRIATLDGWGEVAAEVILVKPLVFPFIVVYMCLTSIGVLNLIVGIMCESAFTVTHQHDQLMRLTAQVKLHTALLALRDELIKQGPTGMLESENGKAKWTFSEIADVVKNDRTLQMRFDEAHLTLGKLKVAADALCFGQPKTNFSVDQFVGACLWFGTQLKNRELDYIELEAFLHRLNLELQDMEKRILRTSFHLYWTLLKANPWNDHESQKQKETTCDFVVVLLRCSAKLGLSVHNFRVQEDEMMKAKKKKMAEQAAKSGILPGTLTSKSTALLEEHHDEEDDEKAEEAAENAERLFARFDGFFGVFLLVNSALIGFETDDPASKTDNATAWYVTDCCFTLVFTAELILRLLLFYQIFVESDTTLYFGFLPHPKPWKQALVAIRGGWKRFSMDPYGISDLAIVIVCLIDNWILHYAASGFNANVILVARFVRMLKVGRIARMFKATGELFLLVRGFVISLRTISWALLLLILLLYVVSIILVTLVTKFDGLFGDGPVTEKCFGTIPRSMANLIAMTTFSGWGETTGAMVDEGYTLIALFVIAMIILTGLGIMNLIVGIMCESAMNVTHSLHHRQHMKNMAHLKDVLKAVQDRFARLSKHSPSTLSTSPSQPHLSPSGSPSVSPSPADKFPDHHHQHLNVGGKVDHNDGDHHHHHHHHHSHAPGASPPESVLSPAAGTPTSHSSHGGDRRLISRKQLSDALADKKLVASFHKANLQLCDVWAIFDRLTKATEHQELCDSANIHALTNAFTRYGQGLKTVDIVAIKVRLRAIERKLKANLGWVAKLGGELHAALAILNKDLPPHNPHDDDDTSILKYVDPYRPQVELLMQDYFGTIEMWMEDLREALRCYEED